MWYKLIVNERSIISVLEDRQWEAEAGATLSLGEFLLDGRELFLKFHELGAVFRVIIPTP